MGCQTKCHQETGKKKKKENKHPDNVHKPKVKMYYKPV